MTTAEIDWGGQREGGATEAELAFAMSLNGLVPGLDYWLHADDDGTPWLLVSLDSIEDRAVRDTLRLDFDERGIRGGWSPSCLNWDGGVRAEEALIDLSGPDGLVHPADGSSVEDLARRAAEWFTAPKRGRWADHPAP
ncbi:hypothetical protein [Saccharothrix coeruleofusca]|uniref:Uncharacterized protein n=1 Tax=Saccharothrix coeruleofusca TaxID=33919 RepID=A0A918EFI6_9PSEU|nr:hypothetical protein [Saccharothrix coeruleofusca]MBP2334855.1 hypothetical protein [Saccharothrix coeruleofusca]GGP73722.1 hypothetical protein GCM10010185_53920 [Saccharothrix coeruleofusca]